MVEVNQLIWLSLRLGVLHNSISFMSFYTLTVWGVEPVVTHETSWLESTGLCGVRQSQAGGSSVEREPNVPLLIDDLLTGRYLKTRLDWCLLTALLAGLAVSVA